MRADARAAVYQDSRTDVHVPPNTHGPRVAPNFRLASHHSIAGDAHALGALDCGALRDERRARRGPIVGRVVVFIFFVADADAGEGFERRARCPLCGRVDGGAHLSPSDRQRCCPALVLRSAACRACTLQLCMARRAVSSGRLARYRYGTLYLGMVPRSAPGLAESRASRGDARPSLAVGQHRTPARTQHARSGSPCAGRTAMAAAPPSSPQTPSRRRAARRRRRTWRSSSRTSSTRRASIET